MIQYFQKKERKTKSLVEVVKMGLHLEQAILLVLPQNIASKPKPEKEKIISKQKTRFNKM